MSSSNQTTSAGGGGSALFWTAVIALSGAGSTAAVRLAAPAALDEIGTAFVLLFLLPALAILLLGLIWRAAGLGVALLLPFVWAVVSREGSDGPLLWAAPVGTGILIGFVAGRATRRLSPAVALVSVVIGVGALVWPGPGRPVDGPRVLLVGIDGATWERIDPLASEGKLPHFARLLEKSHRAKLRSLPSLYSPQIWSSIATGCPTEVHGIEDFGNRRDEFRVGRIWDQLKLEGRSFGLCGWYFTWPPLPGLGDNHFVIPSTLAPDSETFPPEYSFFWRLWAREHLREKGAISLPEAGLNAFRHGIRISTLRRIVFQLVGHRIQGRTALDRAWRIRRLYAAVQGDIFAELIRKRRPEFGAVLFKQVDRVSHQYWKYLEPEGFPEVTPSDQSHYGEAIDEMYVEMDRNLTKIIESAPEDVDLVIVSDHGFQPMFRTMIAGWGCRIRTRNLVGALELDESVFGTNVDQRVFLRPTSPEADERERLLEETRAVLQAAHLTGDGEPVFKVVREGEKLCLTLALRVAVPRDAHITLDGKDYPFEGLILPPEKIEYSGRHHPAGIYLLAGPSVTRSISADSLHVLDVAPTVAALLDLPTSPHWTGRAAVRRLSTAELEVAAYPLPTRSSEVPTQVDETLRDKLKAIGYLE